jgi:hypothetical protein
LLGFATKKKWSSPLFSALFFLVYTFMHAYDDTIGILGLRNLKEGIFFSFTFSWWCLACKQTNKQEDRIRIVSECECKIGTRVNIKILKTCLLAFTWGINQLLQIINCIVTQIGLIRFRCRSG